MTVNTITVGPGVLEIGDTGSFQSFSGQCRAAKVVPSVEKGDKLDVLSGEQVAGDRSESFVLAATFLQDLGAEDSTTEWLFAHRGETKDFNYIPSSAAGKKISGKLVVEAIEMGGEVKTKPASDIELEIIGAPTITAV